MAVHASTGKMPKKRKTTHLKGKKRNNCAYHNTAATDLAHIMQHYSNAGEEPAKLFQLAQQLSLN